ncbi:unnamed protein product [Caenorhabditis angaria]|uniref:Seven TM Receptor n=1 Tax=Caenorhabditis angaria TaxID=860376 RepID=A0A9P1N9W8_9PELO|nr:unnamed protein product [Caenorhabditis angaria]
MLLARIYYFVSVFSFLLTTVSNVLLIILTRWYVRKNLGTYKHLIIIFSSIGLIYDFAEYIFQPMVHSFNSGFIYFSLIHSQYISNRVTEIALAATASLFLSSSAFLAVMFIHRFFSVAKQEQLYYFQGKRVTLWIFYALFFGLPCFAGWIQLCSIDEFSNNYFSSEVQNVYGKPLDTISAFSVIVFDENEKIRWKNAIFIIFVILSMLIQNFIIFFCCFKIHTKIHDKNRNYSKSLRELHSQIFRTLVLQFAIPTLFLFTPAFVIMILPFFGLQLSLPLGYSMCFFFLYPAIDSFIVMYIIKEYKKALHDFIFDVQDFFN